MVCLINTVTKSDDDDKDDDDKDDDKDDKDNKEEIVRFRLFIFTRVEVQLFQSTPGDKV